MGEVGLAKPKARVAGVDAAGRVEAVGANGRGLRHGDEVLGLCRGAFAEYAGAEAGKVVPKPVSLTFEPRSKVTFDMEDVGRGVVKLTVTHDGFSPRSRVLQAISEGWPAVLSS